MKISIFLLMCFGSLVLSTEIFAFVPPQFFVQGIHSFWTVLAIGVAVAITPFVVALYPLKRLFKRYKRTILWILALNVLVALILGALFYFKFYKPLAVI